ncbi:MAG: helix-turn-helix transcriptional regulator [Desulfobacula sp.]|nr:helix-turn-helix transcriptional regulator [Desulfobacula sp.]
MPKRSKYNLPPLDLGSETLGERIARLRKEKGYTQIDIANEIGISQVLISDYERNKIRPHYEMIIRLAMALDITTDSLLGLKEDKTGVSKPNLKLQQRIKKIEDLPPAQQKVLLKTIDTFLKGAQA